MLQEQESSGLLDKKRAKRKSYRSEDRAKEVQESSGILGLKHENKSVAGAEESGLSEREMRRC